MDAPQSFTPNRTTRGTYRPSPVKRQPIPKSGGGVGELGIPTVLDRFIQQAVLQVLQPEFDAGFSEHSYGFRPGRSAHQAVLVARGLVQEGRRWVPDCLPRTASTRSIRTRGGDRPANTRRWWHNARFYLHTILTTRYFDGLGLPRLQP